MTTSEGVRHGDTVTFHFTLSAPSQDLVADTTEGGEPASVTIGGDDMIAGLEKCLLGMTVGQKQRYEIPCEEAYGEPQADSIQVLPRSDFPADMELEPGLVVAFETPGGEEVPGVIEQVSDDEVEIDFSHPLSGLDLVFEVEVLAIEPAVAQSTQA